MCHDGRGIGLVNEDDALGVEVELAVELTPVGITGRSADPTPWLARSFFHVLPCQSKNRHNVLIEKW